MKLNKTSQKIDHNICKALTIACESSLHVIPGFAWLTHRTNYTNFPASLVITCVFETEAEIETMKKQEQAELLRNAIVKQLVKVGVVLKKAKQQIHFDSEEACLQAHQGEWSKRLALPVIKQKPNAPRKLH